MLDVDERLLRLSGLGDQLPALRAERTKAAADFRRASSVMDRERLRVEAEAEIKRLTGVGDKPYAHPLRPDVIKSWDKSVLELNDALPELDESWVATAKSETGIDLGNGVIVPENFKINIAGVDTTVGAILRDAEDDVSMLEAMRTCSL